MSCQQKSTGIGIEFCFKAFGFRTSAERCVSDEFYYGTRDRVEPSVFVFRTASSGSLQTVRSAGNERRTRPLRTAFSDIFPGSHVEACHQCARLPMTALCGGNEEPPEAQLPVVSLVVRDSPRPQTSRSCASCASLLASKCVFCHGQLVPRVPSAVKKRLFVGWQNRRAREARPWDPNRLCRVKGPLVRVAGER